MPATANRTRFGRITRSRFDPTLGQTVDMFRRKAASSIALLILALIAVACSSTTVLGEGRLGAPEQSASSLDASDTPDNGGEAAEETNAGAADSGDTDAGDTLFDRDDPAASLGDDELIEAWSAECLDGSDLACDVLFTITDRGSEAEEIAQTCGGRSDVEVRFCTPDIDPFEDRLWFSADSAGLPDVVVDCESGDLISCDFLYFRSEVGSTYEELGNSCGGRVAIAVPDCRSALG